MPLTPPLNHLVHPCSSLFPSTQFGDPMIVTVTPNPSIDTTFSLNEPLRVGEVMRLKSSTSVAGGKGVNVSHAIHKAGKKTAAIFPAIETDPFLTLLEEVAIPAVPTPTNAPVRVNTAVVDPQGITTKLNGIGGELSAENTKALEDTLLDQAKDGDWVVMAGSLPPGAPTSWYVELTELLRKHCPGVRIAVDTSDQPLTDVAAALDVVQPDLMTPNSMELGQILGIDGIALEKEAQNGNYDPVVQATVDFVNRGVPMALITLGPAGAILASADGVWLATTEKVDAVSTVGAGDCTLAGFILGLTDGLNLADALALGVAYGTTAVTLPGTTIPTPEMVEKISVDVRKYQS